MQIPEDSLSRMLDVFPKMVRVLECPPCTQIKGKGSETRLCCFTAQLLQAWKPAWWIGWEPDGPKN